MPDRVAPARGDSLSRTLRRLTLVVLLASGCGYRLPAEAAARPFDFETDAFAFANETVWPYADGVVQAVDHRKPSERSYTHRCFVLCRAALEFWKFARFEPSAPPLSDEDLVERIHAVTGHGAWTDPLPPAERVVLPGYASVRELSAAHAGVLRRTLGSGWATYFRPGNLLIVFPPSRSEQAALHDMLQASLALNHPVALWLINFPSLDINHAVLAYRAERVDDHFVYLVYDPNDADTPKRLTYDPDRRAFSFEKTFYFEGGEVDVRAVYRNILD